LFTTITPTRPTTIEGWLVTRIADYTNRAPHQVHPTVPLAELGLDSVSAVSLCGEIEDRWQLDIDPTIVFDYPTVTDIAEFLTTQLTEVA
jgi:acyl carrier protein